MKLARKIGLRARLFPTSRALMVAFEYGRGSGKGYVIQVGLHVLRYLRYLVMAVLLASLTACGAGYHTWTINGVKKVYRTDEQGRKTLVYEVDREGNTRVFDESDPMYQRYLAEQQMMERVEKAEAERQERVKVAPKRRFDDPIYVVLHPTKLDSALEQVQKDKGAVFRQVRNEFAGDKVIKLVSQKDLKQARLDQISRALRGKNPYQGPVADVEVVSRAYLQEVHGLNRKTGKTGKMVAVIFEATVTSNHLGAEYKIKEAGNLLRNVDVTERFVAQIKRIIKNKIGPTIPADRSAN